MDKLSLPEFESVSFPDFESAAFLESPSLRSARPWPVDPSPFSQRHSPDKSLTSEVLDHSAVGSTGGILALPDEILAHIFEEAHCSQDLNDAPFERLVLGITQRWRNVALHTPRLWMRIHCGLRTAKEMENITRYLQRSAVYPLEIFLYISGDIMWRTELLEPYRQVFLRCHRLVIDASFTPDFDSGERAVSPRMENFIHFLKSLAMPALYSFEIYGNAESDYTPYASEIFLTAPLLHCAVLVNPRIYCWYPRLMHCKTLLLVLSALDMQSFHLECALSLKQLEVDILFDFLDAGTPVFGGDLNLTLPSLHALSTASYEGNTNIFRFCLNSIRSAPSLEVLCLRGYGVGDLPSDSAKFPELRTLLWLAPGEEHSSHFFSLRNVFSIFKAFPSVARVVYDGPYPESFLRLLDKEDPTNGVRWPQLRVVALAHTALYSRPRAATLASTLSANRSKAGAPINAVYLPPDLTRPWKSADRVKGELFDIQAYLEVLENAEADMRF
ncbi:hypothetical protein FIBSPDRAFT_923701 [Athelia psychrophila]|uniref:Uncharacterized protein n=1 Tax=Athelia psychrophila TaxID=1759441 RepID=A0A166WUY3_9AGAM|nr:hypothetical protein FIBSPDRAFT_923701 [Fibularhizoctonia sp. CBS 109695]